MVDEKRVYLGLAVSFLMYIGAIAVGVGWYFVTVAIAIIICVLIYKMY